MLGCRSKRKVNAMPYRSEEDRQYRIQYEKEIRAYRKSIGLCTRCGKERISPASTSTCEGCREHNRKYMEDKRASMTEEEIREEYETYNARRREREAKRRAEGLCTVCGKPVYDGHSKCIEHFLYHKRKSDRHARQKKKWYAEMGVCRICGKECVEGKKYCQEHYQQKVEVIKKNGAHRKRKEHD